MPIEDVIATPGFQERLNSEVVKIIANMEHVAYDKIQGKQDVQAGDFIPDDPFEVTFSDRDGDSYWGTFSGSGTCHGNWINSGSDNEDVQFENDGPVKGTWSAGFAGGLDCNGEDGLARMVDFEVEVDEAPTREETPVQDLPPDFDK
jgi:hypothetical protein